MASPLPLRIEAPRARGASDADLWLRSIHADDGDALQDYVRRMSPPSRANRFFGPLRELPPGELARALAANERDRLTLLLVAQGAQRETIVGEARVALSCPEREGEFGLSLADDFRGRGLGAVLLGLIEQRVAADGIETLFGDTLRSNDSMIGLAQACGYRLSPGLEARTVRMTKRLDHVAPDLPCRKWNAAGLSIVS
ncbi:MAG TPA: GNAT family N-acetyltransferase [Rhodoblastus sp.]|nr:GNAT family N-acetyltransferase [Rhodoblastus sp.]